MARAAGVHWLRENAQERAPWRVLTVDTETRPATPADESHQVLRLWAARLDRRRDVDPGKPRTERYRGHTAGELADLVESLGRADHALWVVFHNLSFDLAVTALPVVLAERGWRLTEGALTTDSPWARMARKSHRLTIADTWSWLPASVDTLGELLRRRKLPLPSWDDPEPAWWARCERDVDITATAIGQVMDWWDREHLGNWSITGPATGWSSFRHRRPAPHVLVDPDPDARALEARAITGGRREVRRTGHLPSGLYVDLDMPTAHLTAMAGMVLPSRRMRSFASLPLDARELRSGLVDALAECVVETAVPRYPWRTRAGVFYPVGRFRTVLAGPELRDALARGELRSIGRGHTYITYPVMQDWAVWLAGILDPALTDAPAVVRLMAKGWSRSVPGKWAGHTSEVLGKAPDGRPGWQVESAWLPDRKAKADLLLIGGERWTILRDRWSDDAFPAILAWIQSATRVALGHLVDALGDAVVSMNTDGVLVDAHQLTADGLLRFGTNRYTAGQALRSLDLWCEQRSAELAPFSVRVKAAYGDVRVLSPQHLVADRKRRLSGIPARAVSLAGGRYRFTAWPKLRVQLAGPSTPGYQLRETTVDLSHVPPTGWLLTTGEVVPVRSSRARATGPTRDQPCRSCLAGPGALAPPDRQHPLLRPLMSRTDAAA